MGQKIASLEIELLMATGQAVSDLMRFGGAVDKTSAEAIRSLDRIDAAMAGVSSAIDAPTQKMVELAAAASKSAIDAAREFARVERAGESLSGALDRQVGVYGKSAAEVRALKVETAALAAEQKGMTELAGRLRDQQARLAEMEAASARDAAAAAAAKEAEAQAVRDAANAYQLFEARARQAAQVYREQQATEAAAAKEVEAAAVRDAAAAYQAFEARARQASAAYRGQQAEEAARAKELEAVAVREAGVAYQMFEARARAGAQAMRETEQAAERDAAAAARLREMLDPAAAAQARQAQAMAEARRIMQAYGFTAEETAAIEQRLAVTNGGLAGSHRGMSLSMMEAQHIFRAFGDSVASGQSIVRSATMEMGRAVQALSFWAMETGRTEGALGKLSGFLTGPWGIALTVGIAVLAPLIGHLFEVDDAAEKAAQRGLADFMKRQEDMSRFIDKTTGKLIEQSRVLAQIALAQGPNMIGQKGVEAQGYINQGFATARAALTRTGSSRSTGFDSDLAQAISNAGGNITALDAAVGKLAQRRPELNGLANELHGFRGQAQEAYEAGKKLQGQQADLAKAMQGGVVQSSESIKHLVERQAATDAVSRARANLSDIEARGAAIDRLNAGDAKDAALAKYHDDLLAATKGVKAAEQATKDAKQAVRDHKHELTEAAKEARKAAEEEKQLAALYDQMIAKLDPVEGAYNTYEDQLVNIAKLQKGNLIGEQRAMEWRFDAMNVLQAKLAEIKKAEGDLPGWGKIDIGKDIADGAKDIVGILDKRGPGAVMQQQADEARKAWDELTKSIEASSGKMGKALGGVGKAVGGVVEAIAKHGELQKKIDAQGGDATKRQQASLRNQIGLYADVTGAAQGYFEKGSAGYKVLGAAETAFRAIQLAQSIAAMAQDGAETASSIGKSVLRTGQHAVEAVVKAISSLPFPLNIAAGAATIAALAAIGVSVAGGFGGGSSATPPPSPETLQKAAGTGTVLGSSNAQSASIKNALEEVARNSSGVLQYSNQMLSSLKSIDASIGTLTNTIARQLNVSGAIGNTSGLNLGSSGSSGFLGIGASSTTRSLYDAGITVAAATVGNIIANGIAGQTYQIVEQVKKKSGFLGIGGGTKTTYQTSTGELPSDIATSIRSVIGALETGIVTAAGTIGVNGAKAMLDNFTVSIGKLSFNGLDAQGIRDELNAIFSSIGDQMVTAILPDLGKFQKAGEGLFETLERVASTVTAVDNEFAKLGRPAGSIDVAMGIASRFESTSDFVTAADAYFESFYSQGEQTAAKTAEMTKALGALGLTMPDTLAGFRQLVDAQDVTTAAGQQTYATLLQLAPAFADLQQAMGGAKSAADVLSEQQDLQNQLLQLTGDTAAIRAAELAKLDPSNRALQSQIYAIQDAQDAAKAAADLRDAWKSVGDTIMDEVKRVRGLSDTTGAGTFASLMGTFNAANSAARAGDQDAAKSLPTLSKSLLDAAALAATSRQELDRVQAQTAATLEATYAVVSGLATDPTKATAGAAAGAAAAATSGAPTTTVGTATADAIGELRAEVADLKAALMTIASNTGAVKRKLEDVTAQSGGTAITIAAEAA